jgi:hypothetical protein
MKGVVITSDNQQMLAGRFNRTEVDELPLGYTLVTDFGVDEHFVTLTPANFDELFTKGETLKNGFFEVIRIE